MRSNVNKNSVSKSLESHACPGEDKKALSKDRFLRTVGKIGFLFKSNRGQSSVEYVIVSLALLVAVLAMGAVFNRLEEGLFVQHALDSASHSFGSNTLGTIGDVLLY